MISNDIANKSLSFYSKSMGEGYIKK